MKSVKSTTSKYSLALLGLLGITTSSHSLPKGFVYLRQVDPSIKQYMMYYRSDNFLGRRVAGYDAEHCILTEQAARQLKKVQASLKKSGQSLIVYDCYRPREAVQDFIRFARTADNQMQRQFYPSLSSKQQLFSKGYVAKRSNHSAGSTIDLAIIQDTASTYYTGCGTASSRHQLDFGTGVDCLDPRAHTRSSRMSAQVKRNRLALVQIMSRHGFKNYAKEWWHYTLRNEPYPKQQFTFAVT